ncbi:hypothetical protein S40288_05868 [Stachybotrys chartarum IBT 40288]|nr:hypothetical protein S40288_05868 [Stachybotrys chartarum IBT 40288]
MSYYENSSPQWSAPSQSNWEHQGATTPVRAGANGPQPQDDFAFSYQFDEVDRAYENLQKSGKGFMMGGRHARASHGSSRSHSVNYDGPSGSPGGSNLHNFYAQQRHQSSRGSNEAEQVMQAKRRMAAQRERELRNLHTEQQYQRTVVSDLSIPASNPSINNVNTNNNNHGNNNNNSSGGGSSNNNSNNNNKHMSEEETRELIARQRSALYGEGPFADKASYVDESGNVRQGVPGASSTSSLRGNSPLTYDGLGRVPPAVDIGASGSVNDPNMVSSDPNARSQSTTSPQTAGPTNKVFDSAVGQSRTSTSSPTGGSPPRDLAPGTKPGQSGATVAPIGTRPSGTPTSSGSKRSTTPLTSSGGWGRSNGVWGQSSGLGAPASVWG